MCHLKFRDFMKSIQQIGSCEAIEILVVEQVKLRKIIVAFSRSVHI